MSFKAFRVKFPFVYPFDIYVYDKNSIFVYLYLYRDDFGNNIQFFRSTMTIYALWNKESICMALCAYGVLVSTGSFFTQTIPCYTQYLLAHLVQYCDNFTKTLLLSFETWLTVKLLGHLPSEVPQWWSCGRFMRPPTSAHWPRGASVISG